MIIRRGGGKTAMANRSRNTEPTKQDAEKALRDAGLSRKEAKTLLSVGYGACAALNGWKDDLRDADQFDPSQPEILRDAGESEAVDIVAAFMAKIRKLTN